MTKQELVEKTEAAIIETREALLTVYDALNQGQQKKLLKDEKVAAIFKRYGVEVGS